MTRSRRSPTLPGLLLLLAAPLIAQEPPPAATGSDRHHDHHGHSDRIHAFQDAERWAESLNDPARDEWQKPARVVELLDLGEGMTVADLGAGTGYFLPWIADAVGSSGRVLALDVSDDMVDYMRREAIPALGARVRSRVEARRVAHDDPGLAPDSIDRVLVVNTWHHIRDRERYAARLAGALADGGLVAIVDYTLEADRGPPREMRLTPEEVAAELAAGGLEPEILSEELPMQYVVVGRKVR